MIKSLVYEKLPFDLSGSMSKNRFRNELLWGLGKIFDIYEEEEFYVVFDYFCDIEVYLKESVEFYQIKTNKNNKNYTIKKLSGPDKVGNSVFGKVYILKKEVETNTNEEIKYTKIAIVSNTPLVGLDKNVKGLYNEFELSMLDSKSKDKVIENLKKELGIENIDLNNTYYIHTSMDLINPNDSLIGKMVKFFKKITGDEPKKVLTLYDTLVALITEKGCYELECANYQELIEKKGVSKDEMEAIIKEYIKLNDNYVKSAIDMANNIYSGYIESCKLKRSINYIYKTLKFSITMQEKEKKVIECIYNYMEKKDEIESMYIKDLVSLLLNATNSFFDLEDTQFDRMSLIIIVLAKYEEGLYE